jgi:hypothetical protein
MLLSVGSTKNPLQLNRLTVTRRSERNRTDAFETLPVAKKPPVLLLNVKWAKWQGLISPVDPLAAFVLSSNCSGLARWFHKIAQVHHPFREYAPRRIHSKGIGTGKKQTHAFGACRTNNPTPKTSQPSGLRTLDSIRNARGIRRLKKEETLTPTFPLESVRARSVKLGRLTTGPVPRQPHLLGRVSRYSFDCDPEPSCVSLLIQESVTHFEPCGSSAPPWLAVKPIGR